MAAFLQAIGQLGQALGTAKLRQTALSQQAAQQAFQEKIAQRTLELRQLGVEQTAAFRQAQEEARVAAERSAAAYRQLSLALRGAKTLVVADPASPTKWSYQLFVPGQGLVGGKIPGAPPPASAAPKGVKSYWEVDGKSSTGLTRVDIDQNGNILSRTRDILPPSVYLQKSRVSYKVMTNADGSQSLVPVTSPGGPVIPGGRESRPIRGRASSSTATGGTQQGAAAPGAPGRRIPFGHKPLAQMTARTVDNGVMVFGVLKNLTDIIRNSFPNASGQNGMLDKARSLYRAGEYATGFSPGPAYAAIANLHGILTAQLSQVVGQGRINQRLLEYLEKHTPKASDTPALMVDKAEIASWLAGDYLDKIAKANAITISEDGKLSNAPGAVPGFEGFDQRPLSEVLGIAKQAGIEGPVRSVVTSINNETGVRPSASQSQPASPVQRQAQDFLKQLGVIQ